MEFGNELRKLREKNHVGVNQLASMTGVSSSQISRIEHGIRKPKIETLKKLAKGLHISESYMFSLAGVTEDSEDKDAKKSVDLADALDNHEYMTYQGKPIEPEDLELIKRILRNK